MSKFTDEELTRAEAAEAKAIDTAKAFIIKNKSSEGAIEAGIMSARLQAWAEAEKEKAAMKVKAVKFRLRAERVAKHAEAMAVEHAEAREAEREAEREATREELKYSSEWEWHSRLRAGRAESAAKEAEAEAREAEALVDVYEEIAAKFLQLIELRN